MNAVVRLIREVKAPGRSGPENGQYALQKSLRTSAPGWLKIGGELRDGEIPWWWCWLDRAGAVRCAQQGRPFVMGPNMLFEVWDVACGAPGERELCNASSCVLQFTESEWYRKWIAENCGPDNHAPIVLWPYPIDPQPGGPLPAIYDLLVYAKSGYDLALLESLVTAVPKSRVMAYGRYRRKALFEVARRSRACVYLSSNDRGPLALSEILLSGCPTVGIAKGAPWIVEGVTGHHVDSLDAPTLTAAVERAWNLDRQEVRAAALRQLDKHRIVNTILSSLEEALRRLPVRNGATERPAPTHDPGGWTPVPPARQHTENRSQYVLPASAEDGPPRTLWEQDRRPVQQANQCRTRWTGTSSTIQSIWRRVFVRRTAPIRAAMVTANLSLGGAERWVVDLIKHSDPRRVCWTGVAISSNGGADRQLASELASHVRLCANRRTRALRHPRPFYWPAIDEVTGPDFRETIRRATAGADVVVTWGRPDLTYWFEDVTVPRVLCSHCTVKEPENLPIMGVTHLVAVSRVAMAYFEGREGLADLPRTVIYNGADPARCRPRRRRRAIRDEWRVHDNEMVVGFLGRQSEEKNPMAPALAVSRLSTRYHAVYYGVGPTGNGFCPRLMDWCDRVLPGRHEMHVPDQHVGDILHGFDVLMLASHREAFSLTLIEAWLAGTPVVATPVGSVPELEKRHGRLVFQVPCSATAEQLGSAVLQAVDPRRNHAVIRRAGLVARKHFTVSAMVRRWTEYLESVVRGRPSVTRQSRPGQDES